MKNIFFTIVLSVYAMLSFAQTEKKNFLIGGSLTGYYDKHLASPDSRYQNKVWNYGLYPKIGYFVAKNVVCGASFAWARGRITQVRPDLPDTHLKSYLKGVGIFGRYYLRKNNDAVFAELAYSYDANRDVYEWLDDSNTNEILRIHYNGQNNTYSAGIGYSRFLNEKVGVEIIARYRYRWDHAVPGHNNFAPESWSNGVTLGIGFQIYTANFLHRKKNDAMPDSK